MVITFSSMKGGVGKSTDAVLLANNLAARGFKVLFFDMDTNNSSTIYYCMGIANEFPTQNVAEALTHRTIEGCTVKSRIENIDIVPSSLRLFDIRSIDYHALKKTLPVDTYDFIIIDTAPTYDNLVMNALYAADYIFTPVQLDFFNLTTSRFLRSHLYDELPEQVDKWFIFYSFWQENHALFAASVQSQFARIFEREFSNILKDIQIPKTPAIIKYTQTDEKVSVHSRLIGSQRLAVAFNHFADLITQTEVKKDENGNEIFSVEKF
ncbi:MAG: AAA family ATPase [Bacteroides sp.]|nr:AAA family ATPase [Prevotella sp.]MCM1407056.1 AAA family ATPase [Treponema brennaborense]MCM1470208.1 AAA family ATPase [Bacteroides sp.]